MLDLAHVLVRNMRDEIIFWNLGAQIMYGFSKEEALGKIPRELLKTVFPKPFEQIKKELLRTGKWEGELIHRKADGSIIYVASYWVLHKDDDGKPAAVIEVNNDITELKKAEEKLEDYRRNLEKLVEERTKKLEASSLYARNLIEASLDPLVTISAEGKITDVNSATELVTGYSREKLVGSDFLNYFTEPEKARLGYKQVFKEGFVKDYPLSICSKAGRIIDVLYNATVYMDKAGTVQGVFAAARDITERKHAEQKLLAASLYSRSLIEASLDPLVTISMEGKITDVNKATEEVTGCPRKEMIGSDFSDYFTDPEEARKGYQKVFAEGFVKDYPLTLRSISGKITYVLYNASTYNDEKGEVKGAFAAARDITELRKVEAQAQEAEKKLRDAERLAAIGATAGMVGHDIRNPLQAITSDVYLAEG